MYEQYKEVADIIAEEEREKREKLERKRIYRNYNRNLLKTCRNILKDHSSGKFILSNEKLKEVNKLKRKLLKRPR